MNDYSNYIGKRVRLTTDYLQRLSIDSDTINEWEIFYSDESIFKVLNCHDTDLIRMPYAPYFNVFEPECELITFDESNVLVNTTTEEIIYNANDWVVVTSTLLQSSYDQEGRSIGFVFQLSNYVADVNNGLFFINSKPEQFRNHFGINYTKNNIRKATRDEITFALSQLNRNILPMLPNTIDTRGPRILGKIDLDKPIIKPSIKPKKLITIPNAYKGKVLDCIINSPFKINILKSSCTNRKYHDKIINSILPYKIGIEIECCDSLSISLRKNHDEMTKMLNCVSYNDDENAGKDYFCEHRLCFNGHKQIIALYNICSLLQKHCSINLNAGNHYHFDMPELRTLSNKDTDRIIAILTTKLDAIDAICEYKGSYNKKSVSESQSAHTWIRLQSHSFNTIEIRIAAPTFDYKKIVTELILISEVIREVRQEMKFNEYRLS